MKETVMAKFTFADRYAEAGLSPGAQVITSRQEPVNRIVASITSTRVLDLAATYYGSAELDLSWFRDEFAKEDASFSLVNNEREAQVLAALILDQLVANESALAILAVIAGSVEGHRKPPESGWLLHDAKEAFGRLSVENRLPETVETKVTSTYTPKLKEEIAAVVESDWAALMGVLVKIRSEAQASATTVASQSTAALKALDRQVDLLHEESQMLWWLFGGHSRSLERSFDTFGHQQAAIVGAVDLGALTTVSQLGPIAAPAMLERVIALAKRPKGPQTSELAKVVDSFTAEDLEGLEVFPTKVPSRLAPITAAIDLARTMGTGAWHARFLNKTGLDAAILFEPAKLSKQLYREHLLGQLL
jgi:hypothetical protein